MSSFLSLLLRSAILWLGFSAAVNNAATAAPEAVAAATKAAYPLKTCVVSGGKLGGMGKPVEYVYTQRGQPDRTVIFCCSGCIKKFEKDPARFLAKLDAAEAAAKVGKKE